MHGRGRGQTEQTERMEDEGGTKEPSGQLMAVAQNSVRTHLTNGIVTNSTTVVLNFRISQKLLPELVT